jgi:hypothetical protein
MRYVEQRELVIRLHLSAEFPEDYEGEDDGYEWYRHFDERVRPSLVRQLIEALSAHGGYRITPVNRGMDSHEELEIKLEHLARK